MGKNANIKEEAQKVTPSEGTISDDKVSIECQIITYEAMSEIAAQIGKEINEIKPKRVVFCNKKDINALHLYKTFKGQIVILKQQYDLLLRPKPHGMMAIPTLPELTGLFDSLTNFISLFKTDVTITGVKVEIDENSLIAEVISALNPDITIVYPTFKTTETSNFLKELKELTDRVNEEMGQNPDDEKIRDLNNQYSDLLKTLITTDEITGINPLEKVLHGEKLDSIINEDDDINILYLNTVAAGGNNSSKKNIWQNKSYVNGGAIITYFLVNKEGQIEASNNYYNLLGPYKLEASKEEMPKNNLKKHRNLQIN